MDLQQVAAAGLAAAAGAAVGNSTHATAAGLGLALVFARWPIAMTALRIAGAMFLAWLGMLSLYRVARFEDGGLRALSSGERQIVTMLYSASRSPFKSGPLLIDEPELSLHVDWQRIILGEIENQHQGRQIIACTHSPEVGADHESRVQFFFPYAADVFEEVSDLEEAVSLEQ